MINIKTILAKTENRVVSVKPETSVLDTLKLMSENEVGAVVVMDNDRLVGIATERDYARKVVLEGKLSMDTTISEIMTANPVTVGVGDSIKTCMESMSHNHIRHLPVVDHGKLIGVLSIRDMLEAVIEQQEFLIEQMERYIQGKM